jgi:hypothetical protein
MASFGQMIGGGATVAGAAVAGVGAFAKEGKILEWADKVPMGSLSPKTKAIVMGLGLAAIGAGTFLMSGKGDDELPPPERGGGMSR